MTDGTSHTILLCETIDDSSRNLTVGTSLWISGQQCMVDGLPQASMTLTTGGTYPFYRQSQFDNTFGDGSGVALASPPVRTFLQMDFSPAGVVPLRPTSMNIRRLLPLPQYGPSSAHPAVAIVAMGDGSVMAMNKRCDAANMLFLITKNGNDPFNIP